MNSKALFRAFFIIFRVAIQIIAAIPLRDLFCMCKEEDKGDNVNKMKMNA